MWRICYWNLIFFSCICMPPSKLTCLKVTLIPPCCVLYFDCCLCFRCRQACCLLQWWISNCTSARVGSDCSCNQSVQQRWYGGVCHRATVPWMQAENLLQSQHIPGRTIHPTSPSSFDPPGGAVHIHLITCDPSVCCNLCLQTQSPLVEFIAQAPSGQSARLHTQEACGILNLFFLFPIPPLSLSLLLLHWEQIKPQSSSPDSLQFISLLFLC